MHNHADLIRASGTLFCRTARDNSRNIDEIRWRHGGDSEFVFGMTGLLRRINERRQLFRFLILPQILPVSLTLILIRTIEAFKIIDLPNILTGGGPGTATESLTFHAYNLWRSSDLGESAAVSYILLFIVTFVAIVIVNSVRRRLMEWA